MPPRRSPLRRLRDPRGASGLVYMLTLLPKAAPALSFVLFALMAAVLTLPAGQAVLAGVFVSRARAVVTGTPGASRSSVYLVGVLIGVAFVCLQLATLAVQTLARVLGRRLEAMVERNILELSLHSAGLEFRGDPEFRRLLGDWQGEASAGGVPASLVQALVGTVNVAIMRGGALLAVSLLFAFHVELGLLLVVVYLAASHVNTRNYRLGLESTRGEAAIMSSPLYLRSLATGTHAAKEVRTFGLAPWLTARYATETRSVLAALRSGRGTVGRSGVLIGIAIVAAQGLTFALLARAGYRHSISAGDVTTYAVAATGLASVLFATGDIFNMANGAHRFSVTRKLEGLLLRARGDPAPTTTLPAGWRAISFAGVGFRYPGSDRWALRNVDLTLVRGTSLALVGENGAGKSTLVSLLCRFVEPSEGVITVDGVDIRTIDIGEWRAAVGAMLQHPARWPLALTDITTADSADPAIRDEAAALTGVDELVARLPLGWETQLGSIGADSVDLSGGQWQRLALTRTLIRMRGEPGLTILDEPTSALDAEAEAAMNTALLESGRGGTVLLVSHRFSAVRRAQTIAVLREGRLVETGDHERLMAMRGSYFAMYDVQASRYREGVS